jgi:ABC-type nitrate/sulfonate/bicarbonate transport system substrate-binding protein
MTIVPRGLLLIFVFLFVAWLSPPLAWGQDGKPTVKVHTPGPSILSVPFQIAEEQGFYKDEGLNVEFLVMATGAGIQALIAGNVDASQILGLTLRAAINRGAPLKIVLVFNDRPTYWLTTKKEIGSFEDLRGKIIASSSPGASSDALLQRLLAKHGLVPKKDVTIVYIGASTVTYQALVRGSVPAAVMVPPFSSLAKGQGFRELADFGKEDLGPFLGGGVSVGDKFIHERPEVMARFLRATWRGLRLLKTDRKVSVPIMSRFLNLQPEIAESVYESTLPSFTEYGFNSEDWQVKVLEHEVGRADKSSVQKTFDFSVVRSFK